MFHADLPIVKSFTITMLVEVFFGISLLLNTVLNVSKYRVFYGPYLPAFVLNISVFCPNAGKYRPEKTPYLDIFHTV